MKASVFGMIGAVILAIGPASTEGADAQVRVRANVDLGPTRVAVRYRDGGNHDRHGRVRVEYRRGRVDLSSYCRGRRGHPRYGRQWCTDRGWRYERPVPRRYRNRWYEARWHDVHLYEPRYHRRDRTFQGKRLLRLVGPRTYDRLRYHADRVTHPRTRLRARWAHHEYGPAVLEVRADGYPVAELHDYDRDGYVDITLLYRG